MNIYKEMWKITEQLELLQYNGYYPDTENFVFGLKHQLSQLIYFYNKLVPVQGSDASKTFYHLKFSPIEHQLVYVNLNRGYPKEIFDGHYCYVLKKVGTKFTVIPSTSIKESTCINEDCEMKIEQIDGKSCLLHFDDIRAVDPMRIIQNKSYIAIKTDRRKILEKLALIFLHNCIDKKTDT